MAAVRAYHERMAREAAVRKAQEERRVWEQAQHAAGDGGATPAADAAEVGAAAAAAAEAEAEAEEEEGGAAYCLSMHQPWASLLVAGIKRVEGRSWPTDHAKSAASSSKVLKQSPWPRRSASSSSNAARVTVTVFGIAAARRGCFPGPRERRRGKIGWAPVYGVQPVVLGEGGPPPRSKGCEKFELLTLGRLRSGSKLPDVLTFFCIAIQRATRRHGPRRPALIALAAFYSKYYGQCSKAFIRLQALSEAELPAHKKEAVDKLALAIFTRYSPQDPATRRYTCHACNGAIRDFDTRCGQCGTASSRGYRMVSHAEG
mgnify:CR=1 FL=1